MKILYVSSEVAPYSKTGGLADVAGALPGALAARGHQVKVVTPLYGSIQRSGVHPLGISLKLRFPFGTQTCPLHLAAPGGQEVLFIEHAGFFSREGIYGDHGGEYPDNHRRYALLSVGSLSAAQAIGFAPDIVHLNDWQAGLGALALRRGYRSTALKDAKSVFTIHNLAYQGVFHKSAMDDLGLPWDTFTARGLELYDSLSFLKAGLAYSDALNTVSRRYAAEIQTPQMGFGLDGFLRSRRRSLYGILNGVDYSEWNPKADRHLPAKFGPEDLTDKAKCKEELLKAFGLTVSAEAPLFGVVSRLADQKGIDLLLAALPSFLERTGASFIALGSGDPRLEGWLNALQRRFPDRVGVYIGFDVKLAHWIEAGSDFFVMPSRYEPCGLNQMYSLKYGTVPVVRATGGLDDTVIDLASPEGTGIKFWDLAEGALLDALDRAIGLYQTPAWLAQVRERGMRQDFSWERSALRYEALYRSLHGAKAPAAPPRLRAKA